jgi:hypothetical protein
MLNNCLKNIKRTSNFKRRPVEIIFIFFRYNCIVHKRSQFVFFATCTGQKTFPMNFQNTY